jgi:transposase
MNLQLHNVISDITGATGIKIVRDIVAGIRDPKVLSQHRDRRCKRPIEDIEASLKGHYREEHVFALKQALELYDIYCQKIEDCDCHVESFTPKFDINAYMKSITGVDLAAIPGLDGYSILKIISEIGCDMSKWHDEKCFASWLGLSPNNRISGGKKLSSKKMKIANRAASYLRFAANALTYNDSALGAFLRRQKARLGAPKAITATARKIAVIIYEMLSSGKEYLEIGQAEYEAQYRQKKLQRLIRTAKEFGLTLIDDNEQSVSYAEVT